MKFHHVSLEDGTKTIMPEDIVLRVPTDTPVVIERRHLLAYIPWEDRFLDHVEPDYREFFRSVLPYLSARTTNVHTALSVSFVPELIGRSTLGPVDSFITHIAVILHDSGWSQMSDEEVADSLDYSGLFSEKARAPKERHGAEGAALARELLPTNPFTANLTEAQRELICDIIYYHDQMRIWPHSERTAPAEYYVTVEADKLWSYTHENFWEDTVRKGVDPVTYLENLRVMLDTYFELPESRAISKRLWLQRSQEVEEYKRYSAPTGITHNLQHSSSSL